MHLCYSDERPAFTGRPVPYDRQNATAHFVRHFSNAMYLKFVAKNPRSTPQERRRAHVELEICDRKMEHWRRHANFSLAEAAPQLDKIRKDWGE